MRSKTSHTCDEKAALEVVESIAPILAEAFAESDLPWKLDVVDWATTSDTFRQIILAHRFVLRSNTGSKTAASMP